MEVLLGVWPWIFAVGGFGLGAAIVYFFSAAPAQERLAALLDEHERLGLEHARLEERLEAEARLYAARLEEAERAGRALEDRFRSLAAEVLGQNSEAFLKLVSERFEAHRQEAEHRVAAREQAIREMLRPITEALSRFEGRVGELEKAREGAYRAIGEQVRMLAEGQQMLTAETRRLVDALRRPKTRGRWGEFQLQNVLELAGMTEHVDYLRERSVGADGNLRPDLILRLPGGRALAVDAKTPLDAYLEALEAQDEAARSEALFRHARQLRAHARDLGSKEYWRALTESCQLSPDFVVMFVPGEAFFAAAVEQDPTLLEDALARRVVIATPTTFVALVKAVAYGWQQEKLAENAARVAALARELHGRIARFAEHLERLGGAIRQAVDRYNETVASLEMRVVPTLRKFEACALAGEADQIAAPAPVEARPRELRGLSQAAEPRDDAA